MKLFPKGLSDEYAKLLSTMYAKSYRNHQFVVPKNDVLQSRHFPLSVLLIQPPPPPPYRPRLPIPIHPRDGSRRMFAEKVWINILGKCMCP